MANQLFGLSGLVVFLLVVLAELHYVEGQTCQEGLGTCGILKNSCQQKCSARHDPSTNPTGSCDFTITPPLCTCFYYCGPPPPPPKKCLASLGPCGDQCNRSCCNSKCAAKYYQGEGFCTGLGAASICQCRYVC